MLYIRPYQQWHSIKSKLCITSYCPAAHLLYVLFSDRQHNYFPAATDSDLAQWLVRWANGGTTGIAWYVRRRGRDNITFCTFVLTNTIMHHKYYIKSNAVAPSVRAQVSHAEELEFKYQPNQTNDFQSQYVSLPSLAVNMIKIKPRTG